MYTDSHDIRTVTSLALRPSQHLGHHSAFLAAAHPRTFRASLALLHRFGRRHVPAFCRLLKILFFRRVFLGFTRSRTLPLSTTSLIALLIRHARSLATLVPNPPNIELAPLGDFRPGLISCPRDNDSRVSGRLTIRPRSIGQGLVPSRHNDRGSVGVDDVVPLGEPTSREYDALHVRLSRRVAGKYLRVHKTE